MSKLRIKSSKSNKLLSKLKRLRKEPDIHKALKSFQKFCSSFEMLNDKAAGIDIASGEHWVCAPDGDGNFEVKCFGAYTSDLHDIRDWLLKLGVSTVAMESTGVYWIPLYQTLEASGLEVYLVNARELKSVCGRPKTDNLDCQWIQKLHSFGLLKRSFRPSDEICRMRSLWRSRQTLTDESSRCVQRIQKALHEMNLLLPNVVSDITGKTGMLIMKAIVSGERNPKKLALFRDRRVKKSEKEIAESLTGDYRPELIFILKIEIERYEFLLQKEKELDEQIRIRFDELEKSTTINTKTVEANQHSSKKYKQKYKHAPSFDVQSRAHELIGIDLCQIPGLGATTVLGLRLETGTDMSKWKTEKHFTSWLGLSPNPNISAGKNLGTKTKKCASRAAYQFRMAAQALRHSESNFGDFYRRIKSRHGPAHATTATASKVAALYYHLIKNGEDYKEIDRSEYQKMVKEQMIKNLKKKAKKMGYELVEVA